MDSNPILNAIDITMKKICLLLLVILNSNFSFAKEGMWFPQLLKELNESEMKSLGMQINAEDIFNVNKSSIKDAVVQFGGGCTGEVISDRGLLITNHHCGFSQIQSLSTIEKNYLQNGYWSATDAEEIPCPGLTVTFVRDIIDVSKIVLKDINDEMTEENRTALIKSRADSIEKINSDKKSKKSFVRSFFAGNEYYLFITEVFKDIRFVGAPPQSIGNFGGETDNWVWPRHTGDFSLFRIYADKNNLAADYSKDNVPYKSLRSLEINISAVKENDFAMIYGFPGRTNEYATSSAIDIIMNQTDPNKVIIREKRLEIWKQDMRDNDTVRLKYAAKFRTLANYYKKWQGEAMGLKRFNAVAIKENYEMEMNGKSGGKIKPILDSIKLYNSQIKSLSFISDYYSESLYGIELVNLALKFVKLENYSKTDTISDSLLMTEVARLKIDLISFYKNYSAKTDKKICAAMLKISDQNIPASYQPSALIDINSESDILKYTDKLYSSFLIDTSKVFLWLNNYSKKSIRKIQKDPAYIFAKEVADITQRMSKPMSEINAKLNKLQRQYLAMLRSTDSSKKFYPDANSTLRIAYGKIQSVVPADGKYYNYFTTTDGILEKSNSINPEYSIPEKLATLIKNKDYGNYAVNGTVPVAFLASLHSTGGNSGSPVLNAKGQLIGINFDGLWEGIMTDLYYDEKYCRNISMDMHYFLFIVDKFGNANRLIQEMKIVSN